MISVLLNGRLGNQMFQYAICRIVAEKNKYNFYIPEKGSDSTEGVHIKNYFPKLELGKKDGEIKHRFVEDHSIQTFDRSIFEIEDFTEIWGFYQSPKYFENYEKKIRKWFNPGLTEETKKILTKYNPSKYCFIHVRGSDYKNHGHWFLGKDYYDKAMNFMRSKKKDISFVFITDDIKEPSKWYPDIDCMQNNMMIDFELFYHSKYLIIPSSTFSWWPAWLNPKKIVVAPNNWLNYNKPELGFYPVDIKTKEFEYI